MTEIVFKYNPIQVRADILVDGDEIAKTSNLYRYRNTPLEDWVDVLITELVDYSNDDNILIEIRSLQKYIDEINKAIRVYEKKHRHIDIEVRENPSIGYKGRLNKISQIIEQVNEADDRLKLSDVYPLDIIMVSMADSEDYKEMLGTIIPDMDVDSEGAVMITTHEVEEDGFRTIIHPIDELEDRHVDSRVFVFPSLDECSNKYWRLLKEKVNGDRDYLLVALLNDKPKKNDELFDYIAEQLEKKGKINKSRFVFISENPEDNLDYIQDEYGVKLSEILEFDDADEALDRIKCYIQDVSYVRKINELCSLLKATLETSQEEIAREAERNKSVDAIENFMLTYRNTMNTINNHYSSITLTQRGDFCAQNATPEFVELLTKRITDFVIEEVIKIISDYKAGGALGDVIGKWINLDIGGTSGISLAYNLLDGFKDGSKEADLIALTEVSLAEFIVSYMSEHLLLEAGSTTGIEGGLVLQKSYSIYPLIKDKLDVLCKKYTQEISGIIKKNEYGQKMRFFEWVTENIARSDMGLNSYSRSYLNYQNNNYSEVTKKVRRRIKTIEAEISKTLAKAFSELGFGNNSNMLEQKILKIEALTEASMKRFEEKCEDAIARMEISSEDKARIDDIDSLLHDLEEVINL